MKASLRFCLVPTLWTLMLNAGVTQNQGCDCVPLTPTEARDSVDVIFTGKCIQVNSNWISGGMKYSFAVDHCWKKPTDRFYIVNTPFEKDCGVAFEEGKEYLVYVRRIFTPKTNQCLGTKALSDASEDLVILGEALNPKPSSLVRPMYWAVGLLGLFSLVVVAFIVLRNRKS